MEDQRLQSRHANRTIRVDNAIIVDHSPTRYSISSAGVPRSYLTIATDCYYHLINAAAAVLNDGCAATHVTVAWAVFPKQTDADLEEKRSVE